MTKPIGPDEALRRWQDFADDCLAGFPWDVEDYNNDLTLRSRIAEFLAESKAAGDDRTRGLAAQIEAADSRVRSVLRDESFLRFPEAQWWLRRSPAYACRRFCADYHEAYGIEVEPRSRFDDDADELIRLNGTGLPVSDVLIHARDESMYAAARPGLLLRAFREAFPAAARARPTRQLVLSWIAGGTEDSGLRAGLAGQ
ncbi:hypothetical protein [Streptomyces sp. RKAG290]|uniref:hypothetical protein n=1 Tax=Streptomyces sp. RKAG290 TaxID=2888348 RepID=UPI0020346316|nr:hypothetical protein [Streptomyces sp. RKAG290]MCM2412043.1 hypothetical protein [Streptomyces sp. RKAG290]